jgi:CsoR family transcriptional regulator, copper-sensing transcriptional repressor
LYDMYIPPQGGGGQIIVDDRIARLHRQEYFMQNDNMLTHQHDHHPAGSHPLDLEIHEHHELHDHSDTIRRLKTAEGHLRGIQRMLTDNVYCIDVLHQLQAVQSALNKISKDILEQHLNTCVITAIRGEDEQERERVLKEISEVYETATRV